MRHSCREHPMALGESIVPRFISLKWPKIAPRFPCSMLSMISYGPSPVFTHITHQWSTWLLELHRTLRTGGLALISFLGRHMLREVLGEEWNSDLIGMNSLRHSQSWDVGGPTVFHSEWWVRAHWGRGFEVLKVDDNFSAETVSHGFILLRKREIVISTADLEAIESSDTREIASVAAQYRPIARRRAGTCDELSRR